MVFPLIVGTATTPLFTGDPVAVPKAYINPTCTPLTLSLKAVPAAKPLLARYCAYSSVTDTVSWYFKMVAAPRLSVAKSSTRPVPPTGAVPLRTPFEKLSQSGFLDHRNSHPLTLCVCRCGVERVRRTRFHAPHRRVGKSRCRVLIRTPIRAKILIFGATAKTIGRTKGAAVAVIVDKNSGIGHHILQVRAHGRKRIRLQLQNFRVVYSAQRLHSLTDRPGHHIKLPDRAGARLEDSDLRVVAADSQPIAKGTDRLIDIHRI